MLFQERLHWVGAERPRLVTKTDARVELREPSNTSLDPRHADEDQPYPSAVKYGTHLLEAVPLKPAGLVDHNGTACPMFLCLWKIYQSSSTGEADMVANTLY